MNETSRAGTKQRVALLSLMASAGLATVKFAAALLSGSLALLSEAVHSLFDCGATALTLFAVRFSERPADAEHHYGHAKAESIAAFVESGLLMALSAWVAWEAVSRLVWHAHDVSLSWWLFAILLGSILIDFNRSRALSKAARDTSSEALEADALHFRADMWSSAAVLAGLTLVAGGVRWGDAVAALVVSGFIAHAAFGLASRTLNTLLDAAPEGIAAKVEDAVRAVDGVLRIATLRARPLGAAVQVDLAVEVPRTLPAPRLEKLRGELLQAIRAKIDTADVALQVLPVALDTETVFEKASHVAAEHGLLIHHLTVQDLNGKLAVSFDLEVDGTMSLHHAHALATTLEGDIRDGLGGHVEVESHIEPITPNLLSGEAPPAATTRKIESALRRLAKRQPLLSDLHNIRIRQNATGLFVHYHCRFAPQTTVARVHEAVDSIEAALMREHGAINRVIAHAEPVGHRHHKL